MQMQSTQAPKTRQLPMIVIRVLFVQEVVLCFQGDSLAGSPINSQIYNYGSGGSQGPPGP